MPPGDSVARDIRKFDKDRSLNPFRSRSTVICFAVLWTLIVIAGMAMKSGFFDVTFAMACLMVLREIIGLVFGHQRSVDPGTISASIETNTTRPVQPTP